jgi:hypothetical protein
VVVAGGDWTAVDLGGATLRGVSLIDLDLPRARLDHLRMVDGTWRDLRADGASLRALGATDITWERVQLKGADLRRAAIRFGDLRAVDLGGARGDGCLWEEVAWDGVGVGGFQGPDARVLRCVGLRREDVFALRRGGARVPIRWTWLLSAALDRSSASGPRGAATKEPRKRLLGPRRFLLATLDLPRRGWMWLLAHRWILAASGAAFVFWLVFVRAPLDELRVTTKGAPQEIAEQRGQDKAKREADEQRMQEILDALERGDPVPVRDRVELAAILEGFGQYADAEDQLIDAVEWGATVQADLALRAAAQGGAAPDVPPDQDPDLALWRYYLRRNRLHDAIALARERLQDARNPWEEVHARVLITRTWQAGRDEAQRAEEEARVLAMLPTLPDLGAPFWLDLAAARDEAGDLPGALALLLQMPGTAPVEHRAEAALRRAELQARLGDLPGALLAWDRVEEDFPESPLVIARAREARMRVLSEDLPASEASLREMIANDDAGTAVRGALGLARLAQKGGRSAEAELRLEEAVRRHPGPATLPAALELAELRWARGATAEALQGLGQAIASVPPKDGANLRLRASEWLLALGRPGDAEQSLREALPGLSDAPALRRRLELGLARALLARGDGDGAAGIFRQIADAPGDPEAAAVAWSGLAERARLRGALDEAMAAVETAWRLAPPRHRVRGTLAAQRAELLVSMGRADPASLDALLSDARAAGLEEADPAAFARLVVRLGQSLVAAGRPADALTSFVRVHEGGAARTDVALREMAMEGRVQALVALGRQAEADRVVDAMPLSDLGEGAARQRCGAHASLARSRLALRDVPGAVAAWRTLFTECRAPRLLTAVLPEAADSLQEAGAADEAEALLREIAAAPVPDVGRQAACIELVRLGHLEDAPCAEAGPDAALSALARVEHARLLAERGNLAEAEPLWSAVLDDAAAEPVTRALALLGLARLAQVRGDGQLAHERATSAGKESEEPWVQEQVKALLVGLPPKGTPKR